jgi:inner membrane protein involved in colicin E2 resistance
VGLLVTSDDYALLAGALGLFAVLAIAMVLTRHINWYQTSD